MNGVYSFDSIRRNNVSFPADKNGRQRYADAVSAAIRSLDEFPLMHIEQFGEAVRSQVTSPLLKIGDPSNQLFSIRFYLWTQQHPNWAVVLKIITLGITILIERLGKMNCQENRSLIQVAQSVASIKSGIHSRQRQIRDLEKTVLDNAKKKSPPENWVDQLAKISWNRNGFENPFFDLLQTQIISNSDRDISDPQSYLNETRANALVKIYKVLLVCPEQLSTFNKGREVYAEAAQWDKLTSQKQTDILNILRIQPSRYAPLLEERIKAILALLNWDVLYKLDSPSRRRVFNHTSILQGLPNSKLLGQALNALCEHVQLKALKETSWNHPEIEQLKEICGALGLSDEFNLAEETHQIEVNWSQIHFPERLENTTRLVSNSNYYQSELDRRRKEVFKLTEHSERLSFEEWEYAVKMLLAIYPNNKKGCDAQLRLVKECLLVSMDDDESRQDPQLRKIFKDKAAIIGLDPAIIDDLSVSRLMSSEYSILKSGFRTRDLRVKKHVKERLVLERLELRNRGHATDLDRIPSNEELDKLTFNPNHRKVTPPRIVKYEGKANILDLLTYLNSADQKGLIPDILRECGTNLQTILHTKRTVLDAVRKLLNNLINPEEKLTAQQEVVLEILKHYTDLCTRDLIACTRKEETRQIYLDLVELVLKGMGFAYFHCPDRKFNAAMVIYNEKIAKLHIESESIEMKVQIWVANKRNGLLTQLLQEMIIEANKKNKEIDLDEASAVAYWRYVLKDQLGLGDVPPSHYKDKYKGDLTENKILKRFNQLYTAQWILEQAMEEYRRPNGAAELKMNTMRELFKSRFKDHENILYDTLDEETNVLLDCGMALYLQEAGVFAPLV